MSAFEDKTLNDRLYYLMSACEQDKALCYLCMLLRVSPLNDRLYYFMSACEQDKALC
jgi:hypothetical protein